MTQDDPVFQFAPKGNPERLGAKQVDESVALLRTLQEQADAARTAVIGLQAFYAGTLLAAVTVGAVRYGWAGAGGALAAWLLAFGALNVLVGFHISRRAIKRLRRRK